MLYRPAIQGVNVTVDGKVSGALQFSYGAPTAIRGLRTELVGAQSTGVVGVSLLMVLATGWVVWRRLSGR